MHYYLHSHRVGRQQRQAHENPVILWSFGLGLVGPVLVMTVPPIRKRMGWKPAEYPPTTYPRKQYARVKPHPQSNCRFR